METLNDDEMVNNLVVTRQLMGDECRVCLKSCTEACQLFQNDGGLSQKLMAVANIQVEKGDGLPVSICSSCNRLLELTYNFIHQIQNSDIKLRQILKIQTPVLFNQDARDKDIIADVISNVDTCEKDNHVVVQKMYDVATIPPHDIGTFDDTNVSSDVMVDNKSHTNKFTKTEIDREENDALYGALKGSVHNPKMVKAVLCDETQIEMHVDELIHQAMNLSDDSSVASDKQYVKREQVALSNERIETSENSTDEKREDNTIRLEIKHDVSSEDLDNANVSKESVMTLETNDRDTKNRTNCSDDEEKPLISRTTMQGWKRCLHCIKSFTTKMALQRHITHVHKMKLRYVCHICDKQFSNVIKLKSHVRKHDARKAGGRLSRENSQDKKAGGKASTRNNIRNRTNAVTDDTKEEKKNFKFTCKFCSKQFIYQKSFISHAKSHPEYNEVTSGEVVDQSRGKTTSEQRDKIPILRENEYEEEEGEEEEEDDDDDDNELPIESLQCTQCGKLFATKRNLKRHISTHSGLKFHCSTCGKGFSRADKLKDHEQSKHKEEIFGNTDDEDDENDEDNENKVNENAENRKKNRRNRPHKCALCPKAFAQAQSLANHLERHERAKDTQKRFLCEVCSKCFAQSGSLVAHMRTHTGIKPYVCTVCSRAFTKSTYLQLHLRTHSGEKPYICQYCSRAFARANTLARHITMHTGEAKYHCQICTKSFRRLTSLNEHTYTHTGQRPYACKLCTKRYNNAGSLYAHTKKCKAQQLSSATTTYTVSADNVPSQNDAPMSQLLIYSQRKLMEEAVDQVIPTSQYMVANVHNQKTVSANVIQPFAVEDPNIYNTKQFKNPYYTIYPNM